MPIFEESFRIPAPRERVWEFLMDYARVAPCVPGCEEVTAHDADTFTARIRVKVGPISTNQVVRLTITERVPPERLSSIGKGEDSKLASRVTVKGTIRLDAGNGDMATDVRCQVEVQLTGRLATLGEHIMRAKTREMVGIFAERLRQAIASAAADTPAQEGGLPA
jgi:carbon monoxide dehydrogenase subunit G